MRVGARFSDNVFQKKEEKNPVPYGNNNKKLNVDKSCYMYIGDT